MAVFFSPVGNGFQWFNPAGLVLSGGKINTYQAGTTTPQATYTDITGTVLNANPIILDSTGRYAQEIWLTQGTSYKFVITDSLGVTQFTIDNIPGLIGQVGVVASIFSSVSGIRSITSSASIQNAFATGYYAAGDGGGGLYWYNSSDITSTDNGGTILVAADNGRWYLVVQDGVTVKQFGAKGDASTDDTTAIQNALSWVTSIIASLTSGNKLYFPPGFYKITSGLNVNGPAIIEGAGTGLGAGAGNSGGSVIRCAVNGVTFFTCNTAQAVTFRDLTINSTAATPGVGILITQTGANINRQSRIERVNILSASIGISLQNTANYTIRDSFIQDFTNVGIYHTGTATSPDLGDSIIEGNTVWDLNLTTGDSCIRLDPGAAVNIIGNKLLSGSYGVRLTVSQGPTGTLNVVGNSIEQQTIACISLEQTVAGKSYGNVCISANELSILGIGTGQAAIRIPAAGGGQYLANVSIQGNICNMSITTANTIISVFDGNGVSIVGNVINNQTAVGATAAIDVGGNATNVVIDDNIVLNMGGGASYTVGSAPFLQPSHVHTFSTGTTTVAAGSTVYIGSADSNAAEGDAFFYVPFKCKAFRMFVNASAAPGAGQSFTYTLRVGGVSSAITVVNSSAGASDVQDVTHAVSIPAPDGPNTPSRISMQLVTSAGAAVTRHRVTVAFAREN